MTLGSSVDDLNLWIRSDGEHAGMTLCTEIETGVTTADSDPREAIMNYLGGAIVSPGTQRS